MFTNTAVVDISLTYCFVPGVKMLTQRPIWSSISGRKKIECEKIVALQQWAHKCSCRRRMQHASSQNRLCNLLL